MGCQVAAIGPAGRQLIDASTTFSVSLNGLQRDYLGLVVRVGI